jgi:hypothetical protein
MSIDVRLSEPRLMNELVSAFSRHGCLVQRVDARSCRVAHVHADDADQAQQELTFFVRAWQLAYPGVAAVVTPA